MRKSSKLLAVLLTLCLLFGAITAIFASADGEAQDPFNVTKHSANDYLDETTTSYNVKGVSSATYDSTREIKNLSYITLDFDITFTGNPTASDTGRIRILNKVSYYDSEGTAKGHNKTGGGVYIYWNNGNPGIGDTKGISTNGDLNCVDGVYDHITVVMKPNAITSTTNSLDGYQLTQSVYINGIQTGYKIAAAPNAEKNILGVNAMYNGFALSDVTNSGTVKISNVAVNHYTANDASLAACDAYSDVTPLYNIDGLVYNANYKTGNENKYIELSTGEKFYVPAGAAIGAKITDGATVTVKGMNIEDVNVASGVVSFTVVEDGGTFALSEASAKMFEKNGNVYTKKNLSYANDTIDGKVGTVVLSEETGTTSLGWAYNNSAKSPYVSATHYQDSYTRIHYQAGALSDVDAGEATYNKFMEREAEISWRVNNKYNADHELTNKKYMTIDFDFGTDSYAYRFTLKTPAAGQRATYYATAATEAEAVAKVNEEWGNILTAGNYEFTRDLAYPTYTDPDIAQDTSTLVLRLQFAISDKEDALTQSNISASSNLYWYWDATSVSVIKSEDSWYLSAANGAKVKLSNEIGVYDHITFVCEVTEVSEEVEGVECDTTVIVPHVYLNGDYAFDATSTNGVFNDNYDNKSTTNPIKGDMKDHAADYVIFQQLMVQFGKNLTSLTTNSDLAEPNNPGTKMYDRYSLIFDNMTVTYYDEADLANTTLDESMELREPLYTLDGVVYNEDYVTPNTDKYAKVGDETYYVVNAAFNNIQDDDTVYLYNAKAENVGYISAKSFSVVSDGNSTFTSWRCINEEGNNYRKIFDGQVQANVSLDSDGFRFHIYLPIDSSLPADCISWDGAYSDAAATDADTNFKSRYNFNFTYEGVNYYVITWNARTDMTSAKNAYFKLKYNNGETVFDLTDCFRGTFDQIAYMTRAAKEAECSGEDAQLIRAMMDYKVAFLNYISTKENYDAAESIGTIKAFYEIYGAHENDCTCGTYEPEDKNLTDKYINVGTKHDGLTLPAGIQLALGAGTSEQRFYLFFKSTQAYTVFEIEYDNLRGERTTATINCGAKAEDAEYASASLSNIKMYSIDNDFTVTAYQGTVDKDGNVTKGEQIGDTFTLSIADFPTSDTKAAGMITAIKNLAVVAENYKKYVIEQ